MGELGRVEGGDERIADTAKPRFGGADLVADGGRGDVDVADARRFLAASEIAWFRVPSTSVVRNSLSC